MDGFGKISYGIFPTDASLGIPYWHSPPGFARETTGKDEQCSGGVRCGVVWCGVLSCVLYCTQDLFVVTTVI